MASIAATGFALTALCIADHRRYHPHAQLLEQARRTLRFYANTLPHNHGFFFHFNDIVTGHRYRDCELSSIDTALLLCGVLTARAHFHADPEIVSLATKIYNRVDFPWMLNGGPTFAMGWKPDSGFLSGRWNHYSELMMLYLLALGSPTHPVPAAAWDAFTRPHMHFAGFDYISAADPLFVHQFSHAWFDFRYRRDAYADYFANSILATRAHKAFCLNLGKPYSPDYWGISASDSQHGYTAWGGPGSREPNPTPAEIARGFGDIDGSIVPNAVAGSLPFLPSDCLHLLRTLHTTYGDQAYGRYGFCDALHPQANWFDPDVLGIDQGITLLMAENLRSGFVWQTFNRNPEPAIAMKKAGFHPL
ncbi:MAG: glucoamylase family protein [Acidobacteriota bacterium]